MLETVAFTLGVAGILYLLHWAWVNDDGPTATPNEKFTLPGDDASDEG